MERQRRGRRRTTSTQEHCRSQLGRWVYIRRLWTGCALEHDYTKHAARDQRLLISCNAYDFINLWLIGLTREHSVQRVYLRRGEAAATGYHWFHFKLVIATPSPSVICAQLHALQVAAPIAVRGSVKKFWAWLPSVRLLDEKMLLALTMVS